MSFQTIFFLAAIALAHSKPINVVQTHGPLTLSHQPYTISHGGTVALAHAPVAYATAPVATYHAAPAVATLHAAPAVAAVHAAKVEEYDPHPQYSYAYDIKVSSPTFSFSLLLFLKAE